MPNNIISATTNLATQVAAPSGNGVVALISPVETGAALAANTPKLYFRTSDAETDYNVGSKQAVGLTTVRSNSGQPVPIVGVAKRTGSPFTSAAVGNASSLSTGTIDTATRMPIRKSDITAVTRDGTSILAGLLFTNKDPTMLTPSAAQIIVNPKTGVWKSGTATTGAGAGVIFTYDSYDWATAWSALLAQMAFDTVTVPGVVYDADNWGVWDYLNTQAALAGVTVVAATTVGSDNVALVSTNFDVTLLASSRLVLFAPPPGSTGDFSAAFAALVASQPPNATFIEDAAPTGNVTYAGTFVDSALGSALATVSTDFYGLGVNAVYRDRSGGYFVAASRARVATSSSYRNIATQRSLDSVFRTANASLLGLRRSSPVAIPYTDAGFAGIKSILAKDLNVREVARGTINANPAIIMPPVSQAAAADVTAGILRGIDINVGLPGQVEAFVVTINASLV